MNAPLAQIQENMTKAVRYAQQKPPAVSGQGYFGAAYFLGVGLREFGITEESAAKIATEIWNGRCKPPFHPEHLARIIGECFRFKPDRRL